jgi:DNA-binding HxlR family transcriptional regulator
MKRLDVKSHCPINFTIETFGDPWSLLIIRDMAAIGKKTFGEFLDSEERIGRSVLADRLSDLEQKGIITKLPDEQDKRVMVYSLTETGLKSIPIIYEIATWGSVVSPNPVASKAWFAAMKLDKATVLKAWHTAVASGSSFEYGPNSVVNQLGL